MISWHLSESTCLGRSGSWRKRLMKPDFICKIQEFEDNQLFEVAWVPVSINKKQKNLSFDRL
jgi:hypothetical protein